MPTPFSITTSINHPGFVCPNTYYSVYVLNADCCNFDLFKECCKLGIYIQNHSYDPAGVCVTLLCHDKERLQQFIKRLSIHQST